MPHHRRIAWALVCALFASIVFVGPSRLVLAATPKPQCTGWTDDYHPPTTIRVYRRFGPNAGKVDVVPFWKYVGVVLRAEYSTGAARPPSWMRIGAIAVKQYAWYYAGHWRGGKVTVTNPDGTTTSQCYDVQDGTVDQIYHPERWDSSTGIWIMDGGNQPTPSNLEAMRETWHVSLRKWSAKKNTSRLFLTGYRSGKKRPCGSDATGFKIFQKSLRDCGVKGLNLEETLREYYEPVLPVDTRDHDVLADGDEWWGDLGVLAAGPSNQTAWRLYPGNAAGFTAPTVGVFSGVGFSSLIGQGSGNVDAADPNGAADARLLADLVMLTNSGGPKLMVARATGAGFAAPVAQAVPAGVGFQRLLVADFDGDTLADAGLLWMTGPGEGKLVVMPSTGNGTFGAPVEWWAGPLALYWGEVPLAGDVNGDGKADLIVRDPNGTYLVAPSRPSCLDLSVWGPCPSVGRAGLGPRTTWLTTGWPASAVRDVVGDYDRDGRDDVIAVVANSTGIRVVGVRSTSDGDFAGPAPLWQSSSVPFADVAPAGLDINPDGMADLALIHRDGGSSKVMWLRTGERSTWPASMNPAGSFDDVSLTWGDSLRPF